MSFVAVVELVSVEQYLRATYRSDCDFVDGEVLKRNVGEFDHGSTQREILFYLGITYPLLRPRLVPEQRVQVTPTRFRVPDVCLLAEAAGYERIALTPPAPGIEILSPEDTLSRY